MAHKSTHQHRVRFPLVHETLIQGRYMRLFGIKGSRDVRALQREDYRSYKAAAKRGHKIRKAQRKRQRGR